MNVIEAHSEVESLMALIKKEFGDAIEMFVHTDACLDFSCNICTKDNCTVRKHIFNKKIDWTLENIIADKKHKLEQ
jgi:hypothetical protein